MKKIKIIGLGGIGCALAPHLCRYLYHRGESCRIWFIDGDEFESRNAARQSFGRLGNKARIKAEEMAAAFEGLSVRAVDQFVTAENATTFIEEGDTVFLSVDNHASRKLVSDRCRDLKDVLLISGGNEFADGNVQVYQKGGGEEVTHPLTDFHPEIAEPRDANPGEASCDELIEVSPQLLFANLMAAALMLAAYYAFSESKERFDEIYFDLARGASRSVRRKQ